MAAVILQRRNISGLGILEVPETDDAKKGLVYTLTCSVIRPPTSKIYNNNNYNPPTSFYGTITLLRDGFVWCTYKLYHKYQYWDYYPDYGGQDLYATKCSYSGVLQSIANLGLALGVTPTSIINNIKDWTPTNQLWDTAQVVCYNDTAIQLVLSMTKYQICPDDTSPPPPHQPPPPPPPPVPAGTPLTPDSPLAPSPPYESPNDNGATVPYPGDGPPPPPSTLPGTAGELYLIKVKFPTLVHGVPGYAEYAEIVYAPCTGAKVTRGTSANGAYITCCNLQGDTYTPPPHDVFIYSSADIDPDREPIITVYEHI